VAAIYDPVEEFYTMITSAFNWEDFNVTVIRAYEYKNIDLRSGDYLVIEGATEGMNFWGLAGWSLSDTLL
jgi:Ribonuclease G/E